MEALASTVSTSQLLNFKFTSAAHPLISFHFGLITERWIRSTNLPTRFSMTTFLTIEPKTRTSSTTPRSWATTPLGQGKAEAKEGENRARLGMEFSTFSTTLPSWAMTPSVPGKVEEKGEGWVL